MVMNVEQLMCVCLPLWETRSSQRWARALCPKQTFTSPQVPVFWYKSSFNLFTINVGPREDKMIRSYPTLLILLLFCLRSSACPGSDASGLHGSQQPSLPSINKSAKTDSLNYRPLVLQITSSRGIHNCCRFSRLISDDQFGFCLCHSGHLSAIEALHLKIYHQRWGIPRHWMKKVIHIPDNEGGELETRHHLVIISKKFSRGEERNNQK